MRLIVGLTGAVVIAAMLVTVAMAQPGERPNGPSGPGMREGRGGPGGGGPGGPPSPERFIEHAMSFDADGDGKLDRNELTKFAEEMHRMRSGPGGRGQGGPGGRGQGGPGGQGAGRPQGRGPNGPPGSQPGSQADGDRPERPLRPE